MPKIEKRRSPRRALELLIRVFGTDFQGKDFIEDSVTLVVNRHGAMIRLTHQLMPEQEITILCQGNSREALFRVVGRADESTSEFSFWGVECLTPEENIWEGAQPRPSSLPGPKPGPKAGPELDPKLSSDGNSSIQVTLRCSECGMRELVELDATEIHAIHKLKGLVRGCPACGATSLWKPVAV